MSVLGAERIAELLQPYIDGSGGVEKLQLPPGVMDQVSSYLDLLVRWNKRVSLTAVRTPEEMVQRHFGEGLFAAAVLAGRLSERAELLDFGSGAGFPGLPIQMALPSLRVTVAESQARKVAFLREVIRSLGLPVEVWPGRAEAMPDERHFEVVTMRAVDRMGEMRPLAVHRVAPGGWLAALVGAEGASNAFERHRMPGSEQRYLVLEAVPRGTLL